MSVERGASPRRDAVLRALEEHRGELEAMGVTSLAVFGSVARDEAGPNSDPGRYAEEAGLARLPREAEHEQHAGPT